MRFGCSKHWGAVHASQVRDFGGGPMKADVAVRRAGQPTSQWNKPFHGVLLDQGSPIGLLPHRCQDVALPAEAYQ